MASTGSGRTPIVGGNWKMHLDERSAPALARDLRRQLGSWRGAEIAVFPPHPFLAAVSRALHQSAVQVGGQDLHAESGGAFTGGVSGPMLRAVGCSTVLVGHSERRHHFGESDETVARKLAAALSHGLRPVLCIGETEGQRRAAQTHAVLEAQLSTALDGHDSAALTQLVIAYEPVWAIGTGLSATPAQAQEVHAWIRQHVALRKGRRFAELLRIQYGGSVKADNAAALMSQPDIDGALVGGASLDPLAFTRIVRAA